MLYTFSTYTVPWKQFPSYISLYCSRIHSLHVHRFKTYYFWNCTCTYKTVIEPVCIVMSRQKPFKVTDISESQTTCIPDISEFRTTCIPDAFVSQGWYCTYCVLQSWVLYDRDAYGWMSASVQVSRLSLRSQPWKSDVNSCTTCNQTSSKRSLMPSPNTLGLCRRWGCFLSVLYLQSNTHAA